MIDVARYLQRIRYDGPTVPSLETLRGVHLAHMRSVPFENLSVRAGEPILLDEEKLFEKIVVRRRGGFCYELNGLFATLLEQLGFRVARLAGRVGVDGIPFDHMALRVDLDEPWLADVGFGDSFVLPLRLASREPQEGGDGRRYRIDGIAEGLLLLREDPNGWNREYLFTLDTWPLSAFAGGCRYHQTSPRSSFTQKTVVSRATDTGRITLAGRRLVVNVHGQRNETDLDDEALSATLQQDFGIDPSQAWTW